MVPGLSLLLLEEVVSPWMLMLLWHVPHESVHSCLHLIHVLSYARPWQGQSKRMWHGISRYEHSLCPPPRTPMDGTALYPYAGLVEKMNHEPSCVHHYDRHTISLHSKINFHFHFKRPWAIWPFHFNICDGLHFTVTISISVYHVRFLLIATTKFTVGKCFNLTCLYFKRVWWS